LDSIAAISWQLRHDRGRTSRAQLTIWTVISAWWNMPFSTGAVLYFDQARWQQAERAQQVRSPPKITNLRA
jgi:hypothetical protein